MRILLTNDDGIDARGLALAVRRLEEAVAAAATAQRALQAEVHGHSLGEQDARLKAHTETVLPAFLRSLVAAELARSPAPPAAVDPAARTGKADRTPRPSAIIAEIPATATWRD